MDKIKFNARLVAPYFTDAPPEIKDKWLKKSKEAKEKTYRGLKEAIKTRKHFKKKIAKPIEDLMASFTALDPNFVSRRGLTRKNIQAKARDSLSGAGKDYFQKRKDVFETGKYEEKLESGQLKYAQKWCKYLGPLKGYKKGQVKGLSALGVMAICGDPKLKKFLKDGIDTIEGIPYGAVTKKPSRFKRIMANRIVHWGSEIITQGYEERVIKLANQELNQLLNEYRREEIIPFTSGGDSPRNNLDRVYPANSGAAASHIDFIVVEIPVAPGRQEMKKWLGLEIQVSTK